MQNTNTINGLFHIPDENSFIKKLILTFHTINNPNILLAFKTLKEIYPELKMVQKEHYFSLLLPTQSEGVQLEAMLICTEDKGLTLFSIYHRLHFDEAYYPQGPSLIEADAFLDFNAICVNVPLNEKIDALTSLLNYQVKEAINIEINMLTLCDASDELIQEDPLPYIHNALSRYTLASVLDGTTAPSKLSSSELCTIISTYCELPIEKVITSINNIANLDALILEIQTSFIPNFASSTLCLMLLLIEKKTSSAMLQSGNLESIRAFLYDNSGLYQLKDIRGEGELLGDFVQLSKV